MTAPRVEWTGAHRREALRRTYEIAAELVAAGRDDEARRLAEDPFLYSEEAWRGYLCGVCDPARVDREVRRVHALATGRLVRDEPRVMWRVSDVGARVSIIERKRREDAMAERRAWQSDGESKARVTRVTYRRTRAVLP